MNSCLLCQLQGEMLASHKEGLDERTIVPRNTDRDDLIHSKH